MGGQDDLEEELRQPAGKRFTTKGPRDFRCVRTFVGCPFHVGSGGRGGNRAIRTPYTPADFNHDGEWPSSSVSRLEPQGRATDRLSSRLVIEFATTGLHHPLTTGAPVRMDRQAVAPTPTNETSVLTSPSKDQSHGLNHHQRRRTDFLQGLGVEVRPANRLSPRL